MIGVCISCKARYHTTFKDGEIEIMSHTIFPIRASHKRHLAHAKILNGELLPLSVEWKNKNTSRDVFFLLHFNKIGIQNPVCILFSIVPINIKPISIKIKNFTDTIYRILIALFIFKKN